MKKVKSCLNPLLSGSVFLTLGLYVGGYLCFFSLNPLLSGSVFLTMIKVMGWNKFKSLNPLLSGSVFLTQKNLR